MGWKRGSVIMEAKPFAHVVMSQFKEERCNFCLSSASDMKKCAACKKLWYCSKACQKADWKIHKVECQVMSRVPHSPTDSMRLYLRLLICYLNGAANVKHPEDENPCIRTFNDLMSHSDKIKTDPTRSELFTIASDFLRAYTYGILQLPNDTTLLDIFGKMVINTFTIADEMLQDVAVGVYASPSVLDHRCWGNAVASFEGRKVVVRALDNIPSESLSDVFICYVDPLATIRERQEQLQEQYYFTCDCLRCQNTDVDAMMQSVEGSNEGELARVKDCLEKIDKMKKDKANPKDILDICQECLNAVQLPFGNVFLVRLTGKAFDAAIDAQEWEAALLLGIKNYKAYSILHPPFNPCVGYLLANMGKLLMLVGRLSEAMLHLRKAEENFSISLGKQHFLYGQVTEMMRHCEAEMGQDGAGNVLGS